MKDYIKKHINKIVFILFMSIFLFIILMNLNQ